MRIPGWLLAFLSVGTLVFMTGLCSFLSYNVVRTAVIDAADNGVQVPSVAELVDYLIDPPEAGEVLGIEPLTVPDTGSQPQVPEFQLQPTNTPDPIVLTQAATPVLTAEATPGTSMTAIPLSEYLGGANAAEPVAAVEAPPWQGTDRINILLMAIDQRGDEIFEEAFRTDTMIVVQIDPIRRTAGVLSFPRDLWVRIPGFQSSKINNANYLGDNAELPGGGPALAMETMRENFGLRISYYVQFNFNVFLRIVDVIAPNGIEVCISEEIYDPKYPDGGRGTIIVEFQPGCQNLNAERLLQYARTRATQGGDFDRNRRQQEVIAAVQAHILSTGGVGNIIGSIPALYNELAGAYRTNLSVEQILALAGLVAEIGTDNVAYGSVNALHTSPDRNNEGLDILVPNYIAINEIISQTFDPQSDLSLADIRARAAEEDATVSVLNNTSISGLAGSTREWLVSQGVDVTSVGNVQEQNEAATTIILDYTGNTYTARLLAQVMGLPQSAIRPGAGSNIQVNTDLAVVVGADAEQIIGGGG
jgi:polyisoprenyl-teichoic acid--peptidoglycan teichoic acid transferase